MSSISIRQTTITLQNGGTGDIPSQVSYDPVAKIVSLNPSEPLAYSTTYTATVKGGANGVKDANGNPLASDVVWTFTTMGAPTPSPTDPHPFAGRWGTSGAGSGQFAMPAYVAVDSNGDVYVAEDNNNNGNNRIQKFRSDGTFITKWGTTGTGDGQFAGAVGIAVDRFGGVYVSDSDSHRIQKFDSNGNFITKWGTFGSNDGQFQGPIDIAVADEGGGVRVYVSDFGNNRIQKFNSNGGFVTKWGTAGSIDGQFQGPQGITVATSGFTRAVFVTDFGNDRVQKFDQNGVFLAKWGTAGSIDGQFQGPQGIESGSDGGIYVADKNNNRIQKFNFNGGFITKWGTIGTNDGQFQGPHGIGTGSGGLIYVADQANSRVQVFSTQDITPPTVTGTSPLSPNEIDISITPCACATFSEAMSASTIDTTTFTLKQGSNPVAAQVSYDSNPRIASLNPSAPLTYSTTYTATIKGGPSGVKDLAGNALASDYTWSFTTMNPPPASSDPHPFIGRWGVNGEGSGQFGTPYLMDKDSSGNIYVADGSHIQKFKADGTFISKFGGPGIDDGQFSGALGVAVDSADNVYVTDSGNNRVQKFSSSGVFITKWGTTGTAEGEFKAPFGIVIDSTTGNVYVTDIENNRVQKFTSTGGFLQEWGSFGTADGDFDSPGGIDIDSTGNVYVADFSNNRVQKFHLENPCPSGTAEVVTGVCFVTKWGTAGSGMVNSIHQLM